MSTEINVYNREDRYPDCTVQVLTNTFTGQTSVGWWQNEKPHTGHWHCILLDGLPKEHGNYIVLWIGLSDYEYDPEPDTMYGMVWFNGKQWWMVNDSIPEAEEYGGADIIWWMEVPDKPRGVK